MASSLLIGVNLAGAEFGWNVPGVFGVDYTYPTHAEVDYYAAKGMSVIRLPFLWERIQRTELGPLDAAELGRLDDVVTYVTGKDLKIEMMQTGAIAGRVLDEDGEAMGHMIVMALEEQYREGQRFLNMMQSVATDENGNYRL